MDKFSFGRHEVSLPLKYVLELIEISSDCIIIDISNNSVTFTHDITKCKVVIRNYMVERYLGSPFNSQDPTDTCLVKNAF